MRKSLACAAAAILIFSCAFSTTVRAQEPAKDTKPADSKSATEPPAPPPKEESSVTDHTIKIGGQTIPYKATASTTLLKNDQSEPTALIFSIAYTRGDVKDPSQRPIAFVYNGGPGSSSIWLHMGAFGPRRVVTANAEPTAPAPYSVTDNADCLLDKTDLVFIDPVGTGFSHAVGKAKDKDFWGVDEDAKSLAQFISTYVSRNNRWNSSKFLIGESYGTFRSAALGNYLQSHDNMDLNGIVLMSSVLDLGTISFNPGEDMTYVYYLPSYAATAWYHKSLSNRPDDLSAFLAEVRKYAASDYVAALMKGSYLSAAEKSDVAKKLSQYTGLSEEYLIKANLRVKLPQFMIELQRSKGLTTGRLDARFTGPTYDLLGEYANDDPQSTAVSGAFTAVFNAYVREDLKFGQDKSYEVLSEQANEEWNWKHATGRNFGFPGSPNVEGDLIQAMISNPHLRVEVENGFFDLATPFFATEHTTDHLGLPADIQSHIELKYYDAGHMMYLKDADLTTLKNNIASFIDRTSKPQPN